MQNLGVKQSVLWEMCKWNGTNGMKSSFFLNTSSHRLRRVSFFLFFLIPKCESLNTFSVIPLVTSVYPFAKIINLLELSGDNDDLSQSNLFAVTYPRSIQYIDPYLLTVISTRRNHKPNAA